MLEWFDQLPICHITTKIEPSIAKPCAVILKYSLKHTWSIFFFKEKKITKLKKETGIQQINYKVMPSHLLICFCKTKWMGAHISKYNTPMSSTLLPTSKDKIPQNQPKWWHLWSLALAPMSSTKDPKQIYRFWLEWFLIAFWAYFH